MRTALNKKKKDAGTRVAEKKSSKLDIRIGLEQKSLITKAALYSGSEITEFVLKTVLPIAKKIVTEHESIHLDKNEWFDLMQILDNPPKPNKALRDAMKKHLASS
ncbi:MAG: DUF1778 domain-containing protein [Deltaproteobacteria bacterium]|nr:DUF1778 domain-containing protein [Deltaproteobacteria bacterium]